MQPLLPTDSTAYSQWAGAESDNVIIQTMASNDLIFVVLGVTLIIWFTLLFSLYRLDRKLTRLENSR